MPEIFSRIVGTGSALPERAMSNVALAQALAERGVETSDEWIRTRTGIENRYLADASETTTVLAERAARRALESAQVKPNELDLIVVATTTPDQVFPSTACQLQARLEAKMGAAFDIQAVCAGFVYAVNVADAMIRSGVYRNALVVGVDVMSRLIDWNDRTTCVLFGDGAGAVVLKASETPGVLAAKMASNGALGMDVLSCPGRVEGGLLVGDGFLRMDGQQVFRTAVGMMTESAKEVLAMAGMTIEEVDRYVPHQANLRIMQKIAEKLGLPDEKVVVTVNRHGNTSAASVPLALDCAVREGKIQEGDAVLMQAVGAGMAWGSLLVRF